MLLLQTNFVIISSGDSEVRVIVGRLLEFKQSILVFGFQTSQRKYPLINQIEQ